MPDAGSTKPLKPKPGFFQKLLGFVLGPPKRTDVERDYYRRLALDPTNKPLRLEFARWLEESGDPQGEFIRVSTELDGLPEGDPKREKLDARWGELITANGKDWFWGLRRLGLEPKIMGTFFPASWMNDGVIDTVEVDRGGVLPENAAALFEAAPGLRHLTLRNHHEEAVGGEWKTVTHYLNVKAIANLPQMEQLTSLDISGMSLKPDWLAEAVASPSLKNLGVLNLSSNPVGPDGAKAIAESPSLKRLRSLDVSGGDLGDEGVRVLAAAANLASLTELNLSYNRIGPAGARALAASPHLRNLKVLRLSSNAIGPEGAAALAASPHLRELTSLELDSNELGTKGAQALAGSPVLAKLQTLKLAHNAVGGAGVAALAASGHLADVTLLDLSGNEVLDDGLRALAATAMPRLDELVLSSNKFSDEGVKALAAWQGLARVTKLDLSGNTLFADGMRALASSPHLRNLKSLAVTSVEFGPSGAKALAGGAFDKLEILHASGTNAGPEGEQALRKKFGDKVYL